jgi:protein TonB
MIDELTGVKVLIGLVILALIVIGVILFIKNRFRSSGNSDLTEKYRDKKWASPLTARTKYPDVNPFRLSGTFWAVGLAAALAGSIMAFNWTQYESTTEYQWEDVEVDEEIQTEIPRTAEPPPPPPPPPPPVIEEVPDDLVIEEEQPEFANTEIEAETVIEDAPVIVDDVVEAPPPPPPPPPAPEEEEIFKVVEESPRFPGCENKGSVAEKTKCAQQELLKFLYDNLKYPAIARENGIQGQCVVRFVVEKDGSVTQAKILKDIGAGCGDEAIRVVNLMGQKGKKWIPGKQRGRPVRVQFTLPVVYKLEG